MSVSTYINKNSAVFVLLLISFSAISNQDTLFSNDPIATSPQKYGLLAHSAKINASVISHEQEQIKLSLPDGDEVTVLKNGFERHGRGRFTWRGVVEGESNSRVILTLHKGYIVGSIRISTDYYEIRPMRGKGAKHTIEKLDMSAFFEDIPFTDAMEGEPDTSSAPVTPASADASGNDVIHLLAMYSIEAHAGAGGTAQIEAHIQSAVDVANTAFIDSNMSARFVLVHTAPSNRPDSNDSSTDLSWLRSDPGVASLRDQYGADLVSMIIEDGGCGRGYILQSSSGSPNYAHQVTERGCAVGNKTFAHEHGHNIGFAHNPENTNSNGFYDDAHGHYYNGNYRTVMSYSDPCSNGCSRVAHFSNPNVTHNGIATGIANERDNAKAGNVTAAIVAGYRNAVVSTNSAQSQVSQSIDDVEERTSDGYMYFDSSDIELGNDPDYNGVQSEGFRFQNINIPQGATVTSAYIRLVTEGANSEITQLSILIEATDNASAFNNQAYNLSNRQYASNSVEWNISTWSTIGKLRYTPDLSVQVQQVIDRSGWSANNSVVFKFSGSGTRRVESYDSEPNAAATLYVEYDLSSGNQTPTANFGQSCSNLTCTFSDASNDIDGSITAWSWNFGDGNSSTAQHPTHSYANNGNYDVTLIVTDDQEASAQITQSITVSEPINLAPNANFSYSCNDFSCNFTDLSSDSDGSITAWSWNFGDGNSSTAQHPTHSYANNDNYDVTLIVTDDQEANAQITQSITVSEPINLAPNANFSYSCNDFSCNFTDLSSDSDGSITSRTWNFGDGGSSVMQHPSYAYSVEGTYVVTLQVTDNEGLNDTSSQSLTIQDTTSLPPAAPSNLTAEVIRIGKGKNATKNVTLNWLDNADNEEHYIVERCLIEGKGKNKICVYASLSSVSANQTTYSDTPGSGSFRYRVIAENSNGLSAASNSVKI